MNKAIKVIVHGPEGAAGLQEFLQNQIDSDLEKKAASTEGRKAKKARKRQKMARRANRKTN